MTVVECTLLDNEGNTLGVYPSHMAAVNAMLQDYNADATPKAKPATQENLDAFCDRLTFEYCDLFKNDPEYAYAMTQTVPRDLARKITLGLDNGTASKDGKGVKRTCKHFGIPYTYKAIRAFLKAK